MNDLLKKTDDLFKHSKGKIIFWFSYLIPLFWSIVLVHNKNLCSSQTLAIFTTSILFYISLIIILGTIAIAYIDYSNGKRVKNSLERFFKEYEKILTSFWSHIAYIFFIVAAIFIYILSIVNGDYKVEWHLLKPFYNLTHEKIFYIDSALIITITLFAALTAYMHSKRTSEHIKRIQDFYINLRDIAAKVQEMFENATEDIRIISTIPIPGLLTLVDNKNHWNNSEEKGMKDVDIFGLDEFFKHLHNDTAVIWNAEQNKEKLYSKIAEIVTHQHDKKSPIDNQPKIKMILQHPSALFKEYGSIKDKSIEEILNDPHDEINKILSNLPAQSEKYRIEQFANDLFVSKLKNNKLKLSYIYNQNNFDQNKRDNMTSNLYYLGQFYYQMFKITKKTKEYVKNFNVAFIEKIPFLLFIVDNKALFTPLGTEWFGHVAVNETFQFFPDINFNFEEANELLFGIYTEDKKMIAILKEVFNRYFSMHYFLETPLNAKIVKKLNKDNKEILFLEWEFSYLQLMRFEEDLHFELLENESLEAFKDFTKKDFTYDKESRNGALIKIKADLKNKDLIENKKNKIYMRACYKNHYDNLVLKSKDQARVEVE